MIRPRKPEHADKVSAISGVSDRLTVQRHLAAYSYPQNGNVHNPTPVYVWNLLVDGRIVDTGHYKREVVEIAREHGDEYLAEMDGLDA